MDFRDLPEEAAYRDKVRQWLEANAAPRTDGGRLRNAVDDGSGLDRAKVWQEKKYQAGYAGITLPQEYGGAGGTHIHQVIYRQEEARFDVPRGIFDIGLGMCIPTVINWGTDQHRRRYAKDALRGKEVWCQLFSEPAGGSDIAGLRTRAVHDGEDWVVNGQKVWTSGAHYADFGILLTRTDPDKPKHKGLTMFIVNMKAPGVSVRPIRSMGGSAEFNEVFFDDVRIPDSDRLGGEGEGWSVAISTLMFERLQAGSGFGFVTAGDLVSIARDASVNGTPAMQDQRVRQDIARFWINDKALELLRFRAQTALSQGGMPGPEQSISKLIDASQGQRAAGFAMDLLEERGALAAREIGDHWANIERSWMWGAAMRIAGGTDEILKNIIAERLLGLPGDPRPDKNISFRDLSA